MVYTKLARSLFFGGGLLLTALAAPHALAEGNGGAENSSKVLGKDLRYESESGFKFDVNGEFEVQYGLTHNDSDFRSAVPAENNKRNLANNTKIGFEASKDICDGTVGIGLELNADASYDKNAKQTYVYFASDDYGRFEFGSLEGPAIKMRAGIKSLARGTGGADGGWNSWVTRSSVPGGMDFIYKPVLPGAQIEKKPNRVSWYSNDIGSVSFGVSYIPDLDSKGKYSDVDIDGLFRDVLEACAKHKGGGELFGQEATYNLSISGELGKCTDDTQHHLATAEVAGDVHFGNYSLAASYGSGGRSGALRTSTVKSSGYVSLGASYQSGDIGTSITYLRSSRRDGADRDAYRKANLVALGCDYQLTQGVKAYTEVGRFKYDTGPSHAATVDNKGFVVVSGIKVKI